MAKDTAQLSDGNVFKGKVTTDDAIIEVIHDLNWIRATLDNVPGMPFISENDKYAIVSRIAGYLAILKGQMDQFLALPEREENASNT